MDRYWISPAGKGAMVSILQSMASRSSLEQQGKLDEVAVKLQQNTSVDYWCVDFEQPETDPLGGRLFSSILVFRYLHRPLMPAIKSAVQPGGLVMYETFTTDQAALGRPSNPDFLLQPQELERVFQHWDILHLFEGLSVSELSE